MNDASIIEEAAKDGFRAYFGTRGHQWPEPGKWTPTMQSWLIMAAKVLTGELTSGRAAYEHYIDIREAKGWLSLAPARRVAWSDVYWAIKAHQRRLVGVRGEIAA